MRARVVAGALAVGGLILALSSEEKQERQTKTPRMSRQRTEENYKQVTKHNSFIETFSMKRETFITEKLKIRKSR